MAKNKKAATFILKHGLKSAATESILGRLVEAYPDEGFRNHDIHNALRLIEDGFKLGDDNGGKTRRKRKNPLIHGDYADAACYVAAAMHRFGLNEKRKFITILKDKAAID
jgi:hypothetical protein